MFSQFFVLTLYMQQVLHYSALKTGLAYLAFTASVIGFSGVAQALVGRIGIRPVLPVGMALVTAGLVLDTQLPVSGHYFWDIFPSFLLGGTGLALVFVPMSIGALAGVRPADAGVASGLLNTNQQIGGAIGVAVTTTIATTFTAHYVDGHPGVGAFAAPALTHGFQVAFVVLAAIAAATALLAAIFVESKPKTPEEQAAAEAGELATAFGEAA
jgi:MFS family permease